MKKKAIRHYYEDTDRVSVIGDRIEKKYPVDDVCKMEEKIKKTLKPEIRNLFNKLENLHSEREAYSQATGYVQG